MQKRTLTCLARWLLLALLLAGPLCTTTGRASLAAIPAQAGAQRVLYGMGQVPNGLTAADWSQIQALLPASQQAYLKASNTGADDWFGWSVAVSGDTVVVGAESEDSSATGVDGNQADNSAAEAGAAYVFVRPFGVYLPLVLRNVAP